MNATFAAGCFWGVEATFRKMEGVTNVISGYTGGTKVNPTYRDLCSGTTGHSEAVRVYAEGATYEELLDTFWKCHDPCTHQKTQYASIIFYHNAEQKRFAEISKPKGAVTQIIPVSDFYRAEDEHQNYYRV